MEDLKFKGIINIKDAEEKCVTVLDLASASSDAIYSSSSILDLERMPEKIWPDTCFGHKFKYKTMWLYIEFALKKWPVYGDGEKINFPIVDENGLLFWPVRIPETHNNHSKYH
ncbi:Bgt-51948 [Blumeria graminis f. sp. tritici]|uniref:Bgt-51948 n=1 Tax=Blumeria graminis f. sp. tritici TaxID=62690 RepID=A0A9X9MNT0_BLUGR|nr:Bgt-51948 [Blumeria graminis f. sp. tritici]